MRIITVGGFKHIGINISCRDQYRCGFVVGKG